MAALNGYARPRRGLSAVRARRTLPPTCEADRLAELLAPLTDDVALGVDLELGSLFERIAALIAPGR